MNGWRKPTVEIESTVYHKGSDSQRAEALTQDKFDVTVTIVANQDEVTVGLLKKAGRAIDGDRVGESVTILNVPARDARQAQTVAMIDAASALRLCGHEIEYTVAAR